MKYSKLGSTGIDVSRVCLGTMTWGTQNTQQDADEQIAFALDKGINFMDTAEMYSIPPTPESYGGTESIIGDWLSRNSAKRGDIVLASKIAGIGLPWIREGGPVNGASIIKAVDASLARLQTDYIDLYQIHWPNRQYPHFGRHWPGKVPFANTNADAEDAGIRDVLRGLKQCVDAGKIRYCGLSNETPWGVGRYKQIAESESLPLMVSVQNEFNLLCTKDHPYLMEQCVMDDVAYLPWSPLAGGALTGKYLDGSRPEGSRWTLTQRQGLFRDTEEMTAAVKAYKSLAEEYDLSVTQLALKWIDTVEGVTSTIIGATSLEQLGVDIDAFDLEFSKELSDKVVDLLRRHSMPF